MNSLNAMVSFKVDRSRFAKIIERPGVCNHDMTGVIKRFERFVLNNETCYCSRVPVRCMQKKNSITSCYCCSDAQPSNRPLGIVAGFFFVHSIAWI